MKFDPGNKYFIGTFAVFVLGVIGFLIASIFIDFGGDSELKKIEFSKSKFSITLWHLKDDKSYVARVFNGEKFCLISSRQINDNKCAQSFSLLQCIKISPHR